MPSFVDRTGQRFGQLVVLSRAPNLGRRIRFLCKCDCGEKVIVRGDALIAGATVSCKCFQAKANITHGMSYTIEYRIWVAMISRCEDVNSRPWPRYGGDGVTVCRRWRKRFEAFLADMGPRPSPKHSIDRDPDPFGDYKPSNCRWATKTQQAENKRNTFLVEYRGERMAVPRAIRLSGSRHCRETVVKRVKQGVPLLEALGLRC